ncbi:MAG: pyrroline-5-carboxylate reductase, partial [Oscillospiraceae bacterium]
MKDTFAFIGAGNMGGAVARAVCRAGAPERVIIFDKSSEKTSQLSEQSGCLVAESAEAAVRAAHFVFMCVKPNALAEVLTGLCGVLSEDKSKVIVSIAAGVSTATISAVLAAQGLSLPVIRLMPNTPVMVGKGLILVAHNDLTDEADLALLETALSESGMVSRIDEAHIDAATPVFSCSPAYIYMFIEALADGGVMSGLPRDKSQLYAAQAVLGSAAMVMETGKHPGELKDMVCSPGGSTIVGVEELEKAGFRAAVTSAVYEAFLKTTRLG